MCVCCICRELREKIQPEIMELIKQQRLNRLCEGTCFRKISSRRRQGEKHKCAWGRLRSQITTTYTLHPHRPLFCFFPRLSQSVCSPSLPSTLPLIALFPLLYGNPTGDILSQEILETVDSCGLAVMSFLALSAFEAETHRDRPSLLFKSRHVSLSWDARSHCLPCFCLCIHKYMAIQKKNTTT